jgi:hypothetical protein
MAMFAYFLLAGCSNPEAVLEGDVLARVVIPKAAATRTVVEAINADDGTYTYETREVTDVRLLGPVYVGAFGDLDEVSFDYVHPSMGPTLNSTYGDTFPYGGATVGRLDFACYEALACQVTTGRFSDYDALLDHFRSNLGRPVLDDFGVEVTNGDVMQQWCYRYFEATSDAEMAFIGEEKLSFEEDGEDLVADVVLAHTARVDGMKLWAFMDAPELVSDQIAINGSFTTCNESSGRTAYGYGANFQEGGSFFDILNTPSKYVQFGDWVSDASAVVNFDEELNQANEVTIHINFPYEAQ